MKIFKFLFSGILMGNLLVIFAIAIGYATFIENDYDATTARMLVYNARWFEVLMLLMVVNFAGMIFTRKLYRKNQINILLIHVALIIIIVGAAVTRYVGYEGQMRIREGQTSNIFYSTDHYFSVEFVNNGNTISTNEKIILSEKSTDLFNKSFESNGDNYDISIEKFYPKAIENVVVEPNGKPFISMIVGGQDGRHELFIPVGESRSVHGVGFSFNDTTNSSSIQFLRVSDKFFVRFPGPFNSSRLLQTIPSQTGPAHGANSTNTDLADSTVIRMKTKGFTPMEMMTVQSMQNTSFVIKEFIPSAVVKYIPVDDDSAEGKGVVKVRVNDRESTFEIGKWEFLKFGNTVVKMNVGYLRMELPFYLKLNEFQLDRYPGSNSPSSYASEVTLIDEVEDIERPYRIFMNNILDYKGYRFYQSSYDQDEKGTVLSVNHDYWGTLITYIGYFLLFATLIASFFIKKNRFMRMLQQFKEIHEERKKLAASLVVILLSVIGSQGLMAQDSGTTNTVVDKNHAASFGSLQIQNQEGRMSPVNTMATEVLVKIYKKSSYEGMTAEQVLLEMLLDHEKWQNEPLIKVNHPELMKMLGVEGKFASFSDFLDTQGQYKIKRQVDEAYVKKPALRNKLDKELINVNERVNVAYMALNQSILRIFPVPENPDNKWVSPGEFRAFASQNSATNDMLFVTYLDRLKQAKRDGSYDKADESLAAIGEFQRYAGQSVILSESKVKLEVLYNRINIFKSLFPIYLTLGLVLVAIFFIQIFKPAFEFKVITKIFTGIIVLAFVLQTFGLILRWYISGHAPWSNGYESMLYISWVTILSGLIFMKKSPITLGVTALLAGITLLTAHMSWMNPEITNLVPVLKSYWLTIHVATITASYGFLGLGAMMGFLNLCVMIFRNRQNHVRVNLTLKELTLIIELSLSIGLVLLIIGNFLGGIWANESWGRYWGWDPKETWTLVTVIVYSFILHMGMIPSLKSTFSINFMAMIGFGTVLMTYFGVNYYLSGLHSYAGGDPVPIPTFVYYTAFILGLVSLLAFVSDYKLNLAMKIRKELSENEPKKPVVS